MYAGRLDKHVQTAVCLVVLELCRHACALQDQPRAAFVYLVHANRVNQLHDSLVSLYEYFLKDHGPYPVFLFHDEQIADPAKILPEHIADIRWIHLHNFTTFPQHHVQQLHSSQQDWYAQRDISQSIREIASICPLQADRKLPPYDPLLVVEHFPAALGV